MNDEWFDADRLHSTPSTSLYPTATTNFLFLPLMGRNRVRFTLLLPFIFTDGQADNLGTEFVVVFMRNEVENPSNVPLELFITTPSTIPVQVYISYNLDLMNRMYRPCIQIGYDINNPSMHFQQELFEILSQNLICCHWLSNAWEFQINALWDTRQHALLFQINKTVLNWLPHFITGLPAHDMVFRFFTIVSDIFKSIRLQLFFKIFIFVKKMIIQDRHSSTCQKIPFFIYTFQHSLINSSSLTSN